MPPKPEEIIGHVFKQFDKDGNGQISRKELGEVLKVLDPDNWSNPSIDRLLTMADSSGDGSLQIEEFVRWMFAEDGAHMMDVKQYFVLAVSGCSREDLNGEYVQQDEFHGRRPVFFCASNRNLLFYHEKNKRWQIYTHFSSRCSAFMKTQTAPHLYGDADTWKVRKKREDGKVRMLEDPEMKCFMPPEVAPEERLAQAAAYLSITSPELTCELAKTEELQGERPVYANEDGYKACYDAEKKLWKAGNDEGWVESTCTNVYSPELCMWPGQMEVIKVEPSEAEPPAPVEPQNWDDPEFPHSDQSVGELYITKKLKPKGPIVWRSLAQISAEKIPGYTPLLFDDENPLDVKQGYIGNCWLISIIGTMGEFQVYLKEQVFKTNEASADGKYEIRFYTEKKEWEIITVDDCVPCMYSESRKRDYPLFCKSPAGSLWAPLLEKAFAKYFESYGVMEGGPPHCGSPAKEKRRGIWGALELLMAPPRIAVFNKGDGQAMWATNQELPMRGEPEGEVITTIAKNKVLKEIKRKGNWIKCSVIAQDDIGWVRLSVSGNATVRCVRPGGWTFAEYDCAEEKYLQQNVSVNEQEEGFMFQKLKEFDEANYAMVASVRSGDGEGRIVENHAYSVLRAVQVGDFQLVCCRNPWGQGEWTGPWSDQSEEWEAHPEVAEALRLEPTEFDEDGVFWIEISDFMSNFKSVYVSMKTMPGKRGQFLVPEE